MASRIAVLLAVLITLGVALGCTPKTPEETMPPEGSQPPGITSETPDEAGPADETATDEAGTDEIATDETATDDAATTDEGGEVDVAAMIEDKCSTCHSLDRVKTHDAAEEPWSEVVPEMQEKAQKEHPDLLSDDDVAAIVAYLDSPDATIE